MVARPGDGDEVLVTGVSRKPAWEAVSRETVIVAGMTAVALLITALSTVAIVRFALRPLARVASTAAEVATLPLESRPPRNHTASAGPGHRSAHRGRPRRGHAEPTARPRRARARGRRGVGPPDAPVHHRCQPRTAHARWPPSTVTPNLPARTARCCRRLPSTRWPASKPKRAG